LFTILMMVLFAALILAVAGALPLLLGLLHARRRG